MTPPPSTWRSTTPLTTAMVVVEEEQTETTETSTSRPSPPPTTPAMKQTFSTAPPPPATGVRARATEGGGRTCVETACCTPPRAPPPPTFRRRTRWRWGRLLIWVCVCVCVCGREREARQWFCFVFSFCAHPPPPPTHPLPGGALKPAPGEEDAVLVDGTSVSVWRFPPPPRPGTADGAARPYPPPRLVATTRDAALEPYSVARSADGRMIAVGGDLGLVAFMVLEACRGPPDCELCERSGGERATPRRHSVPPPRPPPPPPPRPPAGRRVRHPGRPGRRPGQPDGKWVAVWQRGRRREAVRGGAGSIRLFFEQAAAQRGHAWGAAPWPGHRGRRPDGGYAAPSCCWWWRRSRPPSACGTDAQSRRPHRFPRVCRRLRPRRAHAHRGGGPVPRPRQPGGAVS